MVNEIKTIYSRGLNKGFSSRFGESSRVRHDTPEEGQRTYRPKRKNKDGDRILWVSIYIYYTHTHTHTHTHTCGEYPAVPGQEEKLPYCNTHRHYSPDLTPCDLPSPKQKGTIKRDSFWKLETRQESLNNRAEEHHWRILPAVHRREG